MLHFLVYFGPDLFHFCQPFLISQTLLPATHPVPLPSARGFPRGSLRRGIHGGIRGSEISGGRDLGPTHLQIANRGGISGIRPNPTGRAACGFPKQAPQEMDLFFVEKTSPFTFAAAKVIFQNVKTKYIPTRWWSFKGNFPW